MKRLLSALGSLIVLIGLLPGGAWALWHWGRLDLIVHLTPQALLDPGMSGDLLLVLFTLAGWGAWLLLSASVVSEIVRTASAGRVRWQPPGDGVFGPAAAVLITCIAGLIAGTETGHSTSSSSHASDAATVATAPAPSEQDAAAEQVSACGDSRQARLRWHTVVEGDDLWSLAQRYCGEGSRWREIVAANPTTVLSPLQPLVAGALLEIPESWPHTHATSGSEGPVGSVRLLNVSQPSPATVVVEEGDSLWTLAQEHLHDGALWPLIHRENAQLIADPELILPGQQLRLPAVDSGRGDHSAPPASHPPGTAGDAPVSTAPAPGDPSPGAATPAPPATPGDESSSQLEPVPIDGPAFGNAQDLGAAAQSPAGAVGGSGEVLSDDQDVAEYLHSLIGPMGAAAAAALLGAWALRRRWQRAQRAAGQRSPRPGPRGEAALAAMAKLANPTAQERSPDQPPSPEHDEMHEDPPAHTGSGCSAPAVGDADDEAHQPAAVSPTAIASGAAGAPRSRGPSIGARHEALLVQLGSSPEGPSTLDLSPGGRFSVRADDTEILTALFASLAAQLVGRDDAAVRVHLPPSCSWLATLDAPELEIASDADELVSQLSGIIAARRAQLPLGSSAEPDEDPPGEDRLPREIFLLDQQWDAEQMVLEELGIAVLCVADDSEEALVTLDEQRGSLAGTRFEPALLTAPARRAMEELFEAATSTDYQTAWWWAVPSDPPGIPAAKTSSTPWRTAACDPLGELVALPTPVSPLPSEEFPVPDSPPSPAPFLRMLGPIELLNAHGPRPSRAVKQCEEYCAWILAHPGSGAGRMTRDLLVADATRRSNMSRLRSWLGHDDDGQPYLPDAYTGRICLHPGVSSDWEQFQVLIAGGVNRATDRALHAALSLVRGAPLADAAPGEWRWAEELRTDMVCAIRDTGVALAEHCLVRREIDRARWATSVALAAAPDDELLLCMRLRTEHLAGNRLEVEGLVLRITRHARLLGVDLLDTTVQLLQEVMEGRARARLA
ncbi:LysM domain-containing protein [Propionibacterium cyclohexanicum]|uniref:LysM domain-containing protein n=1 Tax=Propionibacterium cyclohexanicum TaxID=64702 RepID=A0A1H9TH71_9ACTN|nr:LysM peptidoglycan-binding domain-containing protein [Propionibacterium cyclohexanicum]SER96565.1 LysM domain-containing protein [Propionibacterium cyclohexanicum]